MADQSFYERLGLPRDATLDEIKHAYRDLARRLHPDKNIKPGETSLFLEVQEAFEVLSNPSKKQDYDRNQPEANAGAPAISVDTIFSRSSVVQMVEPQLMYASLELFTRRDSKPAAPPSLNICLVLDTSTSMQGARLDMVKASAIELVRHLQANDILSIVKFSDHPEVIIPAGSRVERWNVEARIQMMTANGGTEIFRGLETGFHEVRQYRSHNRVNHIILITDGRTYGDEEACLELAEKASALSITISALGIGTQWNDTFLDRLTSITGGSSAYVSKTEDIRQFLLNKIVHMENSLADNIIFNFTTPPEVELTYAFRLQPEATALPAHSPLVMGSIERNAIQTVLLEFTVSNIPQGTSKLSLIKGMLSYNIPSDVSLPRQVQRLELICRVSEDLSIDPPPPHIVQALSKLTLYRLQERAREDLARGDVRESTRRLQNLATHLLAQGERDLARSVLSEVAYVQQNQIFSEEGEKRIKYGTRSLMLPPGTEGMNR